MIQKRFRILAMALVALISACNQQKASDQQKVADPNVIQTKLADGRVLHYTKQQLAEANSWGISKADYETAVSQGQTHGSIIEYQKTQYWNRQHPGTPPPDVTPPPEMGVTK